MGQSKHHRKLIIGIFLVLFLGIILFSALPQEDTEYVGDLNESAVEASASTNPNSPTYLSDDSYYYESYSSNTNYYYRTSTSASSSYYHVVWVQPTSSIDNFNMYVYSDSSYSNLQASSTRGDGYLDWVIFKPSSSQYYYPKVYTYDAGYAYVEWEDSSITISIGSQYTSSLSSSECIEIYRVYLSSSSTYSFSLSVPSTGDYDLYLYYLSSGSATSYNGYRIASQTTGSGYDEYITSYDPTYTGYYAIVVARKSGSGSYTLSTSSGSSGSTLADDSALYAYYSSSSYYYYQTGSASSSYYHVVWLQPTDSYDNFNLYLYSDSSYSNNKASSTRGSGDLDWVVFRPSYSAYYYPKVYRYSGTGYAYLEWEDSSYSISIGGSYSDSLSSSECIEIYKVYLRSDKKYDLDLTVPSGGDYDLYLYRLSSGSATGYSGYTKRSASYGYGDDESISKYKPSTTDYYAIIVVRESGSGTYTLGIEYSKSINPGIIALIVIGVLSVIGISAAVYKNYSATPPPQRRTPTRTTPQTTSYRQIRPITDKTYYKSPKPVRKPIPNFIFCPYCGSRRLKNELFCKGCGCELEF